MIKGIESDIDKHMYEYNLIINICKNSYRYFKIIDKIFEKLQNIYDESLEKDIISLRDYVKMYKDIYDMKIKTMVNDVHRTIATEDEYLEYSKLLANLDYDELDEFVERRALESTLSEKVKQILDAHLNPKVEESEEQIIENVENVEELVKEHIEIEALNEEVEEEKNIEVEVKVEEKPKSKRGRKPKLKAEKKDDIEKKETKRRVGRPRKEKVNI